MPAAVYIAAFHLLRSPSVLHNSDRKILCVKKSALQSLRTIIAKSSETDCRWCQKAEPKAENVCFLFVLL